MFLYPLLLPARCQGTLVAGFQGSPHVHVYIAPRLAAVGTPSLSCPPSKPRWPWQAGTMTHHEQRSKPWDNPKPAEKERAAPPEWCQAQPGDPLSTHPTSCWQNGVRKTVKKLFKVQRPQSCHHVEDSPAAVMDTYLTRTCKCPVFPCVTNWKAST